MVVKLKMVSHINFKCKVSSLHDKVYVAKIGKTVGLKGQLKLHIDSDFPEQFSKNSQFETNKNINLTIEIFNKKNNVVKFMNFDTIEGVQKLINQQLFTTLENTKKNCNLKSNQYFWFDLEGCKIIENDKTIGKIIEIHRYPISDYFEIETNESLVKEQALANSFLLPYLEQYIIDVNIENKTIVVKGAFDILKAS